MAEEEVGVLCYWNCPIKHGPDGVYFEVSTPPKMMRVKKKTDFSRFLDELYLITGLDKQKSKLELLYRRPLCQWPHKFSHLLYPVENDASFETMLEIPSSHPSVDNVQLYLEVIPTSCDAVAACSLSHLENPRRSSKRRKRTEQEVGDTNSDASFNNAGLCLVSDLWLDNDAMRVGLCFKDIGELKKAVHWWSIKREQKCLVRETGKDMYVFECVRWQCKWSICAAIMEKDGLFEVTKCSGPHTCRRGYSPHFELVFLADEIERVFRVHPTLSTAELVKWWEEKFEYPLEAVAEHHGKGLVQDAKVKAIKRLFGDWDQSFKLLPKLMSAIHSSNGLLVDWQYGSLPNPEYASFRGVFWAFPQSVQGFQHCRPVIVVGSKNLGGKYDMNLMIASAFDAAEQFFPLAFAVTEEVCINSWRWFLTRIREKVTQRQGLCLISILDPDILAVINEPWSQWKEPFAYHRFCLDHLCSQFCSVSPGYEDVQFLVKQAGLSSQKEEFDSYMKKIKEKNPEAWKSLNQIPPQQWALPYDSGRRFGIIKIDSEALFAVCKRFGKVAMAGGVMLLFGELRDAFDESFSRSRGSLSRGDVYIEPVIEKLQELTKGSSTCVVTPLERDAFQVTTKDRILLLLGSSDHTTCRIVQLNDSTCTCGKFQLKKFPCLHALAVCDKLKINPLQYVDDCYTLERYHNTYAATFSPVPKLSAWPKASGVPTLLPPVIGRLNLEEDDDDDDDDDEEDDGDDDDGDDDDDDEDE